MSIVKKILLSVVLLFTLAAQALAATITITGTVTDANGSAPFSVTVTTDLVSVISATVTPAVAPAGTMRTLKVVGSSSAGLPLSAAVSAVTGIAFTPVTGQPAGTFAWTFVF